MKSPDLTVMVFRPSATPSIAIPLGARSVGHYRVRAGWREGEVVKQCVQVFWTVRGRGALVIDGDQHPLGPGRIGVYFPGMLHRVFALAEPWECRWWTMDGILAPAIVSGFGLAPGVQATGPAPVRLFQELHRAIGAVTPKGERLASALAYRLLASAADGVRRERRRQDALVEAAVQILRAEWNHPGLSVKTLAARLGVHRSSLTRRFQTALGVAPVAYLTSLRMQHALSLLASTGLPVAIVARRTGFSDPDYFSRCVSHATGRSPRAFRRQLA
ncbi:helix-turn-helix transcriptional regulator [bacterium]|nr:helix-turn-helix transcriptional regulator [bacterium]